MKKYIAIISAALLALASLTSCQEEPLSEKSVIKVEKTDPTPFDNWLVENFVNPYNIDFKYRFEMGESDMNYYTIPAKYELAIKMAHLVKYLCVDTYDEVAGPEFTRGNFPKMFFLIGEWEYRNNGTYILGTAEGGKKILLSGINYLDYVLEQGADELNYYYIKTIHHEFTHILNQTRDYPTIFSQITGSDYVADSWSEYPFDNSPDPDGNSNQPTNYCYEHGFVSNYAQHSSGEDFAEMVSIYVTNPQSYWDELLKKAGANGAALIGAKFDIVQEYMLKTWGIELDQLRSTILRRQNDVVNGKVDLTDISIK